MISLSSKSLCFWPFLKMQKMEFVKLIYLISRFFFGLDFFKFSVPLWYTLINTIGSTAPIVWVAKASTSTTKLFSREKTKLKMKSQQVSWYSFEFHCPSCHLWKVNILDWNRKKSELISILRSELISEVNQFPCSPIVTQFTVCQFQMYIL